MKKYFILAIVCLGLNYILNAQTPVQWTFVDRKYLSENLLRTKNLLIKETEHLTAAQWNFKENPDRWSINGIVEHLAIWELLFDREISMSLNTGEQPLLAQTAGPDAAVLGFIMEERPHITTDFTKPFTFTVPMELNSGINNMQWWLKMRNESIQFVDSTSRNLRLYFLKPGRLSIHQTYINVFGHIDRHLRQIQKIKSNINYPKS
ncbi:MAG: hypothetical protein NVSMB45_16960 [Ginsengibacter sp.]